MGKLTCELCGQGRERKMAGEMVFSILVFLLTVTRTFAGNNIEYRMNEEINPGYVVGNIFKSYNSPRGDLTLNLMKGGNAHDDFFEVRDGSGNLTTKATIDREVICEFTNQCQISLEVAAQSTSNDGFFDVIYITVIIEDINDNAPTFPKESLDLPISEAVVIGGSSTLEGARDRDTSASFSLQRYELQTKTPSEALPFSVSFVKNLDGSSTVKLIVNEKLDRETKSSYQFYVIAKDGGSPPKNGSLFVTVTITDINDNYPEFDKPSYNVTVREDITIGTPFLNIKATDKDQGSNGLVRFRLSPLQTSDNLKYFTIEELTGNLLIRESLQQTSKSQFKLIVEAIDQGDDQKTSQTSVDVYVLDTSNSAPEVKINVLNTGENAKISEYANFGAVVAHVAVTEHDSGRNGDVNCSLYTRNEAFQLSKYDNLEYKVIVSKDLDREVQAYHDVTVTCSDKGLPPLTASATFVVQVDDENDNAPRFEQQRYFVNLKEENYIGANITTISAYDFDIGDNSVIEYFVDQRSTEYVRINQNTGDVLANKVFDKESRDGTGFSITVYAKDKGVPALTGTATVIVNLVDINDNKPVFNQPLFRYWLSENLPAGTSVGKLSASDNDTGSNALIRFSMKPNQPAVPFVVFDDGVIKTNRELDREQNSQYTFLVVATDVGNVVMSSTATVMVLIEDVNDNDPIIDLPKPGNNTVHVSHLTPSGSVIYRVIAFDRDETNTPNSNLKYTLVTVNSTSLFSINENSGEIILRAPLQNTNYINKLFIMKLRVSDIATDSRTTSASLRVVVVAGNGTVEALTEEQNKNFVIVVIVAAVTVVISVGIIVTICIIRNLDSKRRREKNRQKVLSGNMYSRNNDEVDNIFPIDNYNEKGKKKEVSFSLENGGLEAHQMNRSLEEPSQDTFDQILEPPPAFHQLNIPRTKGHDDCYSDMSGESAGDSGKGGSDDDLQTTNLSFNDDIHRERDRWNNCRSKSPGMHHLQSFPTRYAHPPNNMIPQQKIVPFSCKKNTSNLSSGLTINNLQTQPMSSYGVPAYHDDESHSSSGFQSSIGSNSNFDWNSLRTGAKLNLNRGNVKDCVV